MKKICWITGINKIYYETISKETLKRWELLPGDKAVIVDSLFSTYDCIYKTFDATNGYKLLDTEKVNQIATKGGKYYKFFKKAVSFWYGLKLLGNQYDYIIWLDSDVIIEKSFNVEKWLPNEYELYSTILKTKGPDSGFVAVNTSHSQYEQFVDDYINYYIEDKILNLRHPWDAYIVEDYTKQANVKNLWKGTCKNKDDTTCGFGDTELEGVLTHYWGKRSKKQLLSRLTEVSDEV